MTVILRTSPRKLKQRKSTLETSEEVVDKTTLETSEEDVDKTTLETSEI